MSGSCEVKMEKLEKALESKNVRTGSVYICYKCSEKFGFHKDVVASIREHHGEKECILCE